LGELDLEKYDNCKKNSFLKIVGIKMKENGSKLYDANIRSRKNP
jgi:hypothetical protein